MSNYRRFKIATKVVFWGLEGASTILTRQIWKCCVSPPHTHTRTHTHRGEWINVPHPGSAGVKWTQPDQENFLLTSTNLREPEFLFENEFCLDVGQTRHAVFFCKAVMSRSRALPLIQICSAWQHICKHRKMYHTSSIWIQQFTMFHTQQTSVSVEEKVDFEAKHSHPTCQNGQPLGWNRKKVLSGHHFLCRHSRHCEVQRSHETVPTWAEWGNHYVIESLCNEIWSGKDIGCDTLSLTTVSEYVIRPLFAIIRTPVFLLTGDEIHREAAGREQVSSAHLLAKNNTRGNSLWATFWPSRSPIYPELFLSYVHSPHSNSNMILSRVWSDNVVCLSGSMWNLTEVIVLFWLPTWDGDARHARQREKVGFHEQRFSTCRYVLIDTPGQIEVFTWSASGNIITEALVSHSLSLGPFYLWTRWIKTLFGPPERQVDFCSLVRHLERSLITGSTGPWQKMRFDLRT